MYFLYKTFGLLDSLYTNLQMCTNYTERSNISSAVDTMFTILVATPDDYVNAYTLSYLAAALHVALHVVWNHGLIAKQSAFTKFEEISI